MNTMKALKKQLGEEVNEGRPSAESTVVEYIREHPEARKCDVIRGTGLDKKTVYKYYEAAKAEAAASGEREVVLSVR